MTIRENFLSKNFAPSPIPNGKGHFLSLFQKFLQKNNACHKGKRKKVPLTICKRDRFILIFIQQSFYWFFLDTLQE